MVLRYENLWYEKNPFPEKNIKNPPKNFKNGRIALKLLFFTISSLIWGLNPNNQSIWLGHVRSWWILTIQKPSYEESDHFPRIFALLCCSKTSLCCSKTPLSCSKTSLCCSKKIVYEKYLFFPDEKYSCQMWKLVIRKNSFPGKKRKNP